MAQMATHSIVDERTPGCIGHLGDSESSHLANLLGRRNAKCQKAIGKLTDLLHGATRCDKIGKRAGRAGCVTQRIAHKT